MIKHLQACAGKGSHYIYRGWRLDKK